MLHQQIDRRSLAMATAIAARVDADPAGLERARAVCARWRVVHPGRATEEWWELLQQPWAAVRAVLLDPGEEGCRLRQSSPFTGILTHRERWQIYREHRDPASA